MHASFLHRLCALLLGLLHITSAQWELLGTTDGPSPRSGHSIVTHTDNAGNDILIVFGGRSQRFEECRFNDNWNYTVCGDHHSAKLIDTTIVLSSMDPAFPSCALNCSANGWCTFDETISNSYCICFDDYRGANCELKEFLAYELDVWHLDMATLVWTQFDFTERINFAYADDWPWPSGRFGHSAVMIGERMVVYGGYSPKCLDYCNDIWAWDIAVNGTNKWSIIAFDDNSTAPLWQHGAFLSHDGSFMYTVGGHRSGAHLIDVMQFEIATSTWILMDNTANAVLPPTRTAFAMTPHFADVAAYPNADDDTTVYVHGGYHTNYVQRNESENLRYLWRMRVNEVSGAVSWINLTYDGLNETAPMDEILTELNRWYAVPFPRMEHAMFHVPNTSDLLLFGGYSSGQWFNDTWRFNLETQRWIQHRPPLYFYDFLHPEVNGTTPSSTSEASNATIPSRARHRWTYLPSVHALVVFGGRGNENMVLGVTEHADCFGDAWILYLDGCAGFAVGNECHKNEGHGVCHLQFCECANTHWGVGCEFEICPSSSCSYDAHTLLPECSFCDSHGNCKDGTCECDAGYAGSGCEDLSCIDDCSGHGNCTEIEPGDVQCVCFDGYQGNNCAAHSCPNQCTNRGVCDNSTGICECEIPTESNRIFKPPDCSLTVLASIAIKSTPECCFLMLMSLALLIHIH